MLRITKQTDYGIMILARMAELPPGQVLTTRAAAGWSGLSMPMVSKILKSLVRQRIVASRRGAGGGYSLTQSPDQTTLAAVIRALEGPISIVECGATPGLCGQESVCPTRMNWTRINLEVEQALDRIPISAMMTHRQDRELLEVLPSGPRPEPERGRA